MSQSIYNETISFFVNLIKTTPTTRRSLFDGLLTVGTSVSTVAETQLITNASYSGQASLNVLAIFCDGPISITYNNGITSFTTTINSLAILPGVLASWTITNNGTNTVNVYALSA
jgi:hypothetical protein